MAATRMVRKTCGSDGVIALCTDASASGSEAQAAPRDAVKLALQRSKVLSMLTRAMTTTCAVILGLAIPALGASKTSVIVFSPWSASGLRDGFTVTQKASGSCWTHSLVSDRADAWRCFEGNDILDPCFARAPQTRVVACSESPFSHRLVLLSLKKPLTDDKNATTRWLQPKGEPWGLRLTNGDTCVFATGATDVVAGERMNYACRRTGWIIGAPDRSPAQWWTAHSVDYPNKHITLVRIATAIF